MSSTTSTKPKVVVSRQMPTELLNHDDRFELVQWPHDERPCERDWLLENVRGAHGVVVMLSDKIDQEFIDAAGRSLKVVATMSVGYDHIDVPALKKRGIRLGYTPGVLDDAVADLTLTLALMVTRQIPHASRVVTEGKWPQSPWSPLAFSGPQLRGKTIGFFGFGSIAQTLALRLAPFRPSRLLYTTSKPRAFDLSSDAFRMLKKGGFPTDKVEIGNEPDLGRLAEQSDVIFVLPSLNASTKHALDASFFARTKPSAYIINCSRGPVIDTDALVSALRNGQIAGAGLDVLEGEPNITSDHPLLSSELRDRVALLPHIGSASIETRKAMAELTATNLLAGLGLRQDSEKGESGKSEMGAEVS